MEDFIYESILKTKNSKEFFDAVGKKYAKFSKNEKNELLNTLHSTFYDGISGVPRVMARMCLPLPMPPIMRALRENETIATSWGIRKHIAGS